MKKIESIHRMELRASLDYLSQYTNITNDLIFEIGVYCGAHCLVPNVCAWYKDMNDFKLDWIGIGYTEEEVNNLFKKNENNEFQTLRNGNIIRYAI